ncbi:sialidase family protein [Oleiharenicola lentus]|uniref:sialidase family protein n=1 Tax=Oleiharenicola lentus TaxID=2508720 RepID=UPI003F674765
MFGIEIENPERTIIAMRSHPKVTSGAVCPGLRMERPSRWVHRLVGITAVMGLATLFVASAAGAWGAEKNREAEVAGQIPGPQLLRKVRGFAPLVLPDGTVEHYYIDGAHGKQTALKIVSGDEGATWSEPQVVLSLPAEGKWAGRSPHVLRDRSGNFHLFLLDTTPVGQQFWHSVKKAGQARWSQPVVAGVSCPQTPPIQLRSGRIVVPVGYLVPDEPWGSRWGRRVCTTYYSDDEGATWLQSPARLRVRNLADQSNYVGGYEPVIVELNDGRVWMLIRTQSGRLHESYSTDGVAWSDPQPTDFRSSDSPASLVKLPGGEIVVFWNNCREINPGDGSWLYTGRDALHAAVSKDDGLTWRGFREVYLDDRRNDTPPKTGDRGSAYVNAFAAPNGKIYFAAGQSDNRKLFRMDPAWLTQIGSSDDFGRGLEQWSVFKSFGPAFGYWRDRKAGARLIPDPSGAPRSVLQLRRPDADMGDGAVWNFTAGTSGEVKFELRLEAGFQGAQISLADLHLYPGDNNPDTTAFTWGIAASGDPGTGTPLEKNRWYSVELAWATEPQRQSGSRWPGVATVRIDGREVLKLSQLRRAKAGLSYLRLSEPGPAVSATGFLVGNFSVKTTSVPPQAIPAISKE